MYEFLLYCGKTADWIWMPFGVVRGVSRGMGVLEGVGDRRIGGLLVCYFSHCQLSSLQYMSAFCTAFKQVCLQYKLICLLQPYINDWYKCLPWPKRENLLQVTCAQTKTVESLAAESTSRWKVDSNVHVVCLWGAFSSHNVHRRIKSIKAEVSQDRCSSHRLGISSCALLFDYEIGAKLEPIAVFTVISISANASLFLFTLHVTTIRISINLWIVIAFERPFIVMHHYSVFHISCCWSSYSWMVLLFCCWLTQVVLEKRPLNECSSSSSNRAMIYYMCSLGICSARSLSWQHCDNVLTNVLLHGTNKLWWHFTFQQDGTLTHHSLQSVKCLNTLLPDFVKPETSGLKQAIFKCGKHEALQWLSTVSTSETVNASHTF